MQSHGKIAAMQSVAIGHLLPGTHAPVCCTEICFQKSHYRLAEQLTAHQTAALAQLVAMPADHTDPDSLLGMDCTEAISKQAVCCLSQLQIAHMLRYRRRSKWAESGKHLAAKERSSFCMQRWQRQQPCMSKRTRIRKVLGLSLNRKIHALLGHSETQL